MEPSPEESARALFEENLDLIENICGFVCRRNACYGADAEDFSSLVHIKLLADGCGRLRKFAGRSSLKTFLTIVVANLFRDYRIQRWGKYRPSQAAKRAGKVACSLELLLYRDGRSFDEAVRILRDNDQVEETEAQLADLAVKIPFRIPRLREGEEQLETLPATDDPEEEVLRKEKGASVERMRGVLARGLASLPKEDQLILRMRFEDGVTIARIARGLRLEQRPLYSRIDRCQRHLRSFLEAEGLGAEESLKLIGWDGEDGDE